MAQSVAWIVLVVADLNPYLVAAQVNALRTAALGSGQTDPFDDIMPDVIASMRADIAACSQNVLSQTANSIPPELKMHAVYLILEEMQTRLPTLKLTDQQKKMADKARDRLEKISTCDIPIQAPSDPETDGGAFNTGSPVEVVTHSTRVTSRSKLDGL